MSSYRLISSSLLISLLLLVNNVLASMKQQQPQTRRILPSLTHSNKHLARFSSLLSVHNHKTCVNNNLFNIRGGGGGEQEEDNNYNNINDPIQSGETTEYQSIANPQSLSSMTASTIDNNTNGNSNNIKLIPTVRISLVSSSNAKRKKQKDKNKKMIQIERRNVSKFDLCTEFQCSLRDIRNLVSDSKKKPSSTSILSASPAFTNSRYTQPSFLIRDNYIILHLDYVRVVIQSNYQVVVFLLSNDNEENHDKEILQLQSLVHTIIQQIHHTFHLPIFNMPVNNNDDNDPFLDAYKSEYSLNQTKTNSNKDATAILSPSQFQLTIFDVLLSHISSSKSNKADILTYESNNLLFEMLPPSLIQQTSVLPPLLSKNKRKKKENFLERQIKLGKLLILKNKVDKLISNCEDLCHSITELLKNEDDMLLIVSLNKEKIKKRRASSLLSSNTISSTTVSTSTYYNYNNKNHHDNEEYMNIEILLEDYLLQFESIKQYIQTIQSYILNTEEVLNIELDYIRNRIMQYEVFLSIFGLVIGMAAAVTGLFGMNLLSHLEFYPNMFWNVTFGLVLSMIFLGSVMIKKLMNDNIW